MTISQVRWSISRNRFSFLLQVYAERSVAWVFTSIHFLADWKSCQFIQFAQISNKWAISNLLHLSAWFFLLFEFFSQFTENCVVFYFFIMLIQCVVPSILVVYYFFFKKSANTSFRTSEFPGSECFWKSRRIVGQSFFGQRVVPLLYTFLFGTAKIFQKPHINILSRTEATHWSLSELDSRSWPQHHHQQMIMRNSSWLLKMIFCCCITLSRRGTCPNFQLSNYM